LVRLGGRLRAEGAQACVVTLLPVAFQIETAFAQDYSTDPSLEVAQQLAVESEDEDAPEPIGPGGLDLGEMVAQQLAVALDPYPRIEGAEIAQAAWGSDEPEEEAPEEAVNPFAVLREIQKRH
jgi:uncharacterized metal-binding protein YceD (DUF177 family)